ncbi:TPA: DUF4262 domain-containing protein [Vibrio parahaemolyticus]
MGKCSCECKCPVCAGEATYEQTQETLNGMAEARGFAITGTGFPWYTVGMAEHGLPDIIFSIPSQNMVINVLNHYYDHVKKNGITLGNDKKFMEDIGLGHLDCLVLELDLNHKDDEHFNGALAGMTEFYDRFPERDSGGENRVIHLMYPDSNNLFPFEVGYDFDGVPQNLFGFPKDVDTLVEFSLSRGQRLVGMDDALMEEAESQTKH